MGELATVTIVSPKDGKSRWTINADDYDDSIHILWSDAHRTNSQPISQEPASVVPREEPFWAVKEPGRRMEMVWP